MAVVRVQPALDEFAVVLLEVAAAGFFQQVVPLVHLDAERVEGRDDLRDVRDDGVLFARQLREVVALDVVEQREFHLLRVDEHELELRRVLAVEQADEDGVEAHRLALTGGAGHQEVGHFGQIKDERLVRNRLADGHRQGCVRRLELVGGDQRPHRHHVGRGIRDLDAHGAAARNGRDDPDAEGGEAQGDVVLEVLDLRNPDAGGRHDFVQGHGRAHFRLDARHLDAEVAQRLEDAVLVRFELAFRHAVLAVPVVHQEVDGRKFEAAELKRGVVLAKLLDPLVDLCFAQHILLVRQPHLKRYAADALRAHLCGRDPLDGLHLLPGHAELLGQQPVEDVVRVLGFVYR